MPNITVTVTFRELLDSPLCSGWEYICEKYGFNPYCINEGLVDSDETTTISYEDAKYIGLIKESNTY